MRRHSRCALDYLPLSFSAMPSARNALDMAGRLAALPHHSSGPGRRFRRRRVIQYVSIGVLVASCVPSAFSQIAFTWQQIREKFEATNPTLQAGQIGINESRAQEITAYLRPNPDVTGLIDQINPFSTQPSPSGGGDAYRPFAFAFPSASISYLHERQHKRELRRDSARKATDIAISTSGGQERTLLFQL